jgi:hypothetical protein
MSDQIRIEPRGEKFAIVLEYGGSMLDMDVREPYKDAEEFAFYLASCIKLDVYHKGKKINGREDYSMPI